MWCAFRRDFRSDETPVSSLSFQSLLRVFARCLLRSQLARRNRGFVAPGCYPFAPCRSNSLTIRSAIGGACRISKMLSVTLSASTARAILHCPKTPARWWLETILKEAERTITLYAATIMPNHAHMLFSIRPLQPEPVLYRILQTIKRISAWKVNRALGRSGQLWQPESLDRMLRTNRDESNAATHISRQRRKNIVGSGTSIANCSFSERRNPCSVACELREKQARAQSMAAQAQPGRNRSSVAPKILFRARAREPVLRYRFRLDVVHALARVAHEIGGYLNSRLWTIYDRYALIVCQRAEGWRQVVKLFE